MIYSSILTDLSILGDALSYRQYLWNFVRVNHKIQKHFENFYESHKGYSIYFVGFRNNFFMLRWNGTTISLEILHFQLEKLEQKKVEINQQKWSDITLWKSLIQVFQIILQLELYPLYSADSTIHNFPEWKFLIIISSNWKFNHFTSIVWHTVKVYIQIN